MSADLLTAAGAIAFCEQLMVEMRETFLREGEYPSPDGFVLATCDLPRVPKAGQKVIPGQKLPEPLALRIPKATIDAAALMQGARNEEEKKDMFAYATKALAQATNAVGVVLLMEAWYMTSEGVTPPPEGRWFKGEVRHQPNRREGLFISLEHKEAGYRRWIAEIQRNPTRLGLFKGSPMDRAEGRFTNLAGGS